MTVAPINMQFPLFFGSRWPAVVTVLTLAVILLASCNQPSPERKLPDPGQVREPLLKANKEAVQTENEQIRDFLRRYKWPMQETGSGLLYHIYVNGSGPEVENGDLVEISYVISLLNGDTVYNSAEKGSLVFVSGRAQVISGLEEGILLLKKGDRAKFIIPSHLAFGLIGDQDKIGQKATLVYDINVINVRKNHP